MESGELQLHCFNGSLLCGFLHKYTFFGSAFKTEIPNLCVSHSVNYTCNYCPLLCRRDAKVLKVVAEVFLWCSEWLEHCCVVARVFWAVSMVLLWCSECLEHCFVVARVFWAFPGCCYGVRSSFQGVAMVFWAVSRVLLWFSEQYPGCCYGFLSG